MSTYTVYTQLHYINICIFYYIHIYIYLSLTKHVKHSKFKSRLILWLVTGVQWSGWCKPLGKCVTTRHVLTFLQSGRRTVHSMFGLPAGTAIFSPCPLLWFMNTRRFPDVFARPQTQNTLRDTACPPILSITPPTPHPGGQFLKTGRWFIL